MKINLQLATINPRPYPGAVNAWHARVKLVSEIRVVVWLGWRPSLKSRDGIRVSALVGGFRLEALSDGVLMSVNIG